MVSHQPPMLLNGQQLMMQLDCLTSAMGDMTCQEVSRKLGIVIKNWDMYFRKRLNTLKYLQNLGNVTVMDTWSWSWMICPGAYGRQ
mgnify:CR=1 FL=1